MRQVSDEWLRELIGCSFSLGAVLAKDSPELVGILTHRMDLFEAVVLKSLDKVHGNTRKLKVGTIFNEFKRAVDREPRHV